jgi:uncharacterized protein (DUF1800 family)
MLASARDANRRFLDRICYGVRPTDLAAILAMGSARYLEQQLAPPVGDDPTTQAALAAATMPIKNAENVTEQRPLTALGAPIETLWQFAVQNNGTEVLRVVQEVKAATWIRAVNSPYQLRERVTEFWHDHFNVSSRVSNQASASFMSHDRDAIRPHALGNFRKLLDAVATSTSMLYYLSNQSSRAAVPNENYARELMELHTLGVAAYFEFKTPPVVDGIAAGYTDIDVVNAAKALSGWTVENGTRAGNRTLPQTGKFVFVPEFHNKDARQLFGVYVPMDSASPSEGKTLLDKIAVHPATAVMIATRLARRFISDTPPQSVIDAAAAVFLEKRDDPAQLAHVMRAILTAPEGLAVSGEKVKRPFDLVAGFLRATQATVNPQQALFSALDQTGHTMFEWGAPNGHPDTQAYWLTTNTTLRTWNLLQGIFQSTGYGASSTLLAQTGGLTNPDQIVDFWLDRLLGYRPDDATYAALVADARSPTGVGVRIKQAAATAETSLRRLVALIAASPAYMMR